MSEKIIESHILAMYRFLGHAGGFSRVGSFDYSNNHYEQSILKGEKEVLEYANRYNGQRNVFISRAARNEQGDVLSCSIVSFDIDPIRPKGLAATNDQHNRALTAGRKILGTYPGGYLSSSGNGCLLLYSVPSNVFGQGLEEYYRREAVLIKELQALVNGFEVKIDATNYAEAMLKLIGTASTKGQVDMRRISRFIEAPIPPYRTSTRLLSRLNNIVAPKPVATESVDLQALRSKFEGDRSKADFYLVDYLHKAGAGPEVAAKLLSVNPLGRRDDEKDQSRLIGKIYGKIKEEKNGSYFEKLFIPQKDNSLSIKTGFDELDKILGPLPKGEFTTFAARSGYGKTTFALTLAERLRSSGKRVLYFSTEMSEEYIMHKLVAIAKNIPIESLVQKTNLDVYKEAIKSYESELRDNAIAICDSFQPTIEEVKAQCVQHQPDVLIFDHVTQAGTHWEHIAQFMRDLKQFVAADDSNIVGIALSQLNEPPRGKDGTEMQSLRGDVRGSQEVIYLSAIFCYLTNPYEVKGDLQPVEFHVAKNRYGISGTACTLFVDRVISKFLEKENSNNE